MLMQYVPLVGAVLAGVCQAAPSKILSPEIPVNIDIPVEAEIAGRSPAAPLAFPLNKFWDNEVLFSGLIDAEANVELGLSLPKAAIKGDIALQVGADFILAPTVKVLLGGVQANIAVDVAATAGVFQSIELVGSEQLSVAIPGLLEVDVGAGFALDLVVGVSAAVDLSAGFYINFPEGSFVEVNLLTREIVRQSLDGLVAVPLPLAVGAEVDLSVAIELNLGLRLRAELGISADLDLLGLDIGAGAGVSIWVALFDYTTVLVNTPECALSVVESFDFNIGLDIEVDIDIAHLGLTLAPTVSATLAAAPVATICLPPGGGAIPLPGVNSTNPGQQLPGHGNVGGEKPTSTDAAVGTITPAPTNANQTGPYPTSTGLGPGDLVTSTIHTTKTYTITSCAASVPNCPASHTQQIVTSTVISTVVTCPASTSTADSVPTPITAHTTVTLTTCPVPTTGTFVPPKDLPTPVPTVTVGYPTGTPSPKPSGYPTQPAPVTTPSAYPTGEVTKPGNGGGEVTPTPLPSVSYPAEQPSSYPVQQPSSYPVEQPPSSYPAQQPTYPASSAVQPPSPSGTGAGYPEQPCATCLPITAGAGRAMSHALAGVVVAGAAFALL